MPAARLHSLNRDVDFIADIELGANNNFVCKRRGACNTSPLWPPFHRQSRRYSSVAPSKGLHRRAVTSAAPHGGHSIPDYSYPSSATTSQSDLTPSYSWGATTPTGGYDGPSHNTTQGSSLQVPHNLTANDAWSYYLEVVQNPLRTAEFGNASLSRLPLSPPLIVQLVVRDRTGKAIYPEIETPFLLAHLALLSADGMTQVDMGSSPGGTAPPRRLLYGNLVSSPHRLRDLHNKQGLFFLFPDVSIRWRGQYRLEISLVRLSR
ncbi:hypothetical protein PLICRDRAFT_178127 [Plicaturopsis crispa FD-325 SS-3]|nr:hypothetical protein PLICRDRAFT_178127 [Plicaturopsis crispa FD-325 SS-3]